MRRGLLDINPDTQSVKETYGLATIQNLDDYGLLILEGFTVGSPDTLTRRSKHLDFSRIVPAEDATNHLGMSYRSLRFYEQPYPIKSIADVHASGYVKGADYDSLESALFPSHTTIDDKVVLLKGGQCSVRMGRSWTWVQSTLDLT